MMLESILLWIWLALMLFLIIFPTPALGKDGKAVIWFTAMGLMVLLWLVLQGVR